MKSLHALVCYFLILSACNNYYRCVVTTKEKDDLYIEAAPVDKGSHMIYPKTNWDVADQISVDDTIWINKKTFGVRVDKHTGAVYKK